jgi:hypothetical protein
MGVNLGLRVGYCSCVRRLRVMLSTRPIAAGSIPVSSASLNFPSFVVQNLKEKGIENLFPAQAEVVPFLMREGYH